MDRLTYNEKQIFNTLDEEQYRGIMFIMENAGTGYYETLQILGEMVKQGIAEKELIGRVNKYRKAQPTSPDSDSKPLEPDRQPIYFEASNSTP